MISNQKLVPQLISLPMEGTNQEFNDCHKRSRLPNSIFANSLPFPKQNWAFPSEGSAGSKSRKTSIHFLFFSESLSTFLVCYISSMCIISAEMVSFSVAGFGWPRKSCRQNRFTTTTIYSPPLFDCLKSDDDGRVGSSCSQNYLYIQKYYTTKTLLMVVVGSSFSRFP